MKKQFQCLLVLLALVTPLAWSQGITFQAPGGWQSEIRPDKRNKAAAPNAILSSEADKAVASLSYMKGRDVSGLKTEDLRALAVSMAEDTVATSREGKATAVAFNNGNGMYVRLTDKTGKADTKYNTIAVSRNGSDLALGQLFSSDDDGAMLAKFLVAIRTVSSAPDSAPVASAPPAQAGPAKGPKAASSAKDSWGALSVEQIKGDTDPNYGVGGGSSQAEAEKSAQRFCRESGGKRCTIQLAYTQCGAYAVSASGFGVGIGATEKTAEKAAMDACKDKSCSVVVADCN
ncbi:MAG: DUF4189 domain-containing protein [Pseudomonadota bacterium]